MTDRVLVRLGYLLIAVATGGLIVAMVHYAPYHRSDAQARAMQTIVMHEPAKTLSLSQARSAYNVPSVLFDRAEGLYFRAAKQDPVPVTRLRSLAASVLRAEVAYTAVLVATDWPASVQGPATAVADSMPIAHGMWAALAHAKSVDEINLILADNYMPQTPITALERALRILP